MGRNTYCIFFLLAGFFHFFFVFSMDSFSPSKSGTILARLWGQDRPHVEKVDKATAQLLSKHVGTVWRGLTHNGEAWGVLCYQQGEMVFLGLETPLAASNKAMIGAKQELLLFSTHSTTKVQMWYIFEGMCNTPAKEAAVKQGENSAIFCVTFAKALQCIHMSDLQLRTRMDPALCQLEPPLEEKRQFVAMLNSCENTQVLAPHSELVNFRYWLNETYDVTNCDERTHKLSLTPVYFATSMLMDPTSPRHCPVVAKSSPFLVLGGNLMQMMDRFNGKNCHPHAPSLAQWVRAKLLELSSTTDITEIATTTPATARAELLEPPHKRICGEKVS